MKDPTKRSCFDCPYKNGTWCSSPRRFRLNGAYEKHSKNCKFYINKGIEGDISNEI